MTRVRGLRALRRRNAPGFEFWRRFRKNRGAVAGLLFLLLIAILALLADIVAPNDPMTPGVGDRLEAPGSAFPMGTDNLGRDILSGVVHGARVSLVIGITAASISALIGTLMGAASGYFGGAVDEILMRVCELFQSMPRFLFALVIVVFFGNSIWNVVLVLGILSWTRTGRLVRAEFLRLRGSDFVVAAKASGASEWRIIVRHVFPNVVHIIVVTTSLEVGDVILAEAGLSFLGAGDPNLMSWGRMLYTAQRYLRTAWWFSVFPGMAIFLTILALNLFGDGLNDALNPRLRRVAAE